jgi:hypothetical protein
MKWVVCVGAPFEQQTLYGPFETIEDAYLFEGDLPPTDITYVVALYESLEDVE